MEKERLMSPIFRSYLRRGLRWTTKPEIARQMARETGRRPIDFINEKLRDVYLRAYPDLADMPNGNE